MYYEFDSVLESAWDRDNFRDQIAKFISNYYYNNNIKNIFFYFQKI